MARDPPSLLEGTELRDIPLQPSAVQPAAITIIHPQLRDLIVAVEPRCLLYPRGKTVEEVSWEEGSSGKTRTYARLDYTPTCLAARDDVFACGAQHGELYIRCGTEEISQTLPSHSINNNISILPLWPDEWADQAETRRLGHTGRGSRTWVELDPSGRAGYTRQRRWARAVRDEPGEVATYPNTVPFIHAPRIPRAAGRRPSDEGCRRVRYVTSRSSLVEERSESSRRSSLDSRDRATPERRLLISNNDQTVRLMGIAPSAETLPPPLPFLGSSLGYDFIGLNEGIRANTYAPRLKAALYDVGSTKLKVAVNHSSLSPDLSQMVTVGDSTDVFLYHVAGQEFHRVGAFKASSDSGFSTAWSKDGRKFAVASQDGQVTVWDHSPLAVFHTSSARSADLARHAPSDVAEYNRVIVDPHTGESRYATSVSGREAARVVKFSPEGSGRDLLVFSEECSNIHIIDAQTFDTHVVLPVPVDPLGALPPSAARRGVEKGTWGIAGVAFDPSGDWLYSGTERTVVEWDLRRQGSRGSSEWAMA